MRQPALSVLIKLIICCISAGRPGAADQRGSGNGSAYLDGFNLACSFRTAMSCDVCGSGSIVCDI